MTLNSDNPKIRYPVFLPGRISDHVRWSWERDRPQELMPLKPPNMGSSLHQVYSAREREKHPKCKHTDPKYLNMQSMDPRWSGQHSPGDTEITYPVILQWSWPHCQTRTCIQKFGKDTAALYVPTSQSQVYHSWWTDMGYHFHTLSHTKFSLRMQPS